MIFAGPHVDLPQTLALSDPVCPGAEATIRVYAVGHWTVLEGVGELGWFATRELRDLLQSLPSSALVFDLSEVSYLDHNAFALLAQAHRTRRSLGGAVRLVEPPRSTCTLMRLARNHELPPVFATIEEATA